MMKSQLDQGIEAHNQDFKKYDQVSKIQRYRLSENEEDQFDEDYQIKICDMSQFFSGGDIGKKKFAQELGESLEDVGFAIITGHEVDQQLYRKAKDKVIEFFEGIPLETKKQYQAKRQGSVNQGYFPVKTTTIIHPDLVEGWVFCRRAFDLDQNPNFRAEDFWPDSKFLTFFRTIVQQHEPLILPFMQSILRYLNVDPHLYDEKLMETNFGFRLNYYPPLQEESNSEGGRMLGHEDIDLFTILPASEVEGLQALHRGSMKWVRVNAPQGSIIINTGDYMQRITNDRLPSTTHRVSRPRNKALNSETRVTFPMAVYVWEEEMLKVLPGLGKPKYPPVKAIEFHTKTTSKFYGDDYAVS